MVDGTSLMQIDLVANNSGSRLRFDWQQVIAKIEKMKTVKCRKIRTLKFMQLVSIKVEVLPAPKSPTKRQTATTTASNHISCVRCSPFFL